MAGIAGGSPCPLSPFPLVLEHLDIAGHMDTRIETILPSLLQLGVAMCL